MTSMNKKVLIAMSGGVDSAVAALLLKERGFECLGITMRLFSNDDIGEDNRKSCCSLEDAALAEQAANRLNIPFYVFNLAEPFKKQVIARFVSEYQRGATPNPCIDCNRYIKFELLFARANQLGIDYVATGHYAQIEEKNDRFLLKKGTDLTKDQSYVLYSMTQKELSRTIFPLGKMEKSQVRKLAADNNFLNAQKPDSQDICFVSDKNYADFIEKYTGEKCPEGDFVDINGKTLGRHKGHIHYTIGQRKGLNIALGEPMYVRAKDPLANTVTLCGNDGLFTQELTACDFNWISQDAPEKPIRIKAKIRYTQEEQWGTAQVEGEKVRITFDAPQRAIAKGQAVVIYDGELVVGGGTIL